MDEARKLKEFLEEENVVFRIVCGWWIGLQFAKSAARMKNKGQDWLMANLIKYLMVLVSVRCFVCW